MSKIKNFFSSIKNFFSNLWKSEKNDEETSSEEPVLEMSDEDAIREFAENYIKALNKGDHKWFLKSVDFHGMWEWNKEQMGDSYTTTPEEFEKEFKDGAYLLKSKWDKNFSIKSISIEGERAKVEIDAEGASSIGSPLVLSKKSGAWKYIMGTVWFW